MSALASGARRTGAATGDLPSPPIFDPARIALFADLDGTLAPIEETPRAVGPDPRRRQLLDRLGQVLQGRLAVVSGRAMADVDRVLEGVVPAVAAVHGLVRRSVEGAVVGEVRQPRLEAARKEMLDFARRDRRLIVEDKGVAVALHYRRAPDQGKAAHELVRELARRYRLREQQGDMVAELRPSGPDKGEAVRAFMREAPFAGHRPIFLGDDLTDEPGFAAAQDLDGAGIIVGARRPTLARYALADVASVRLWLEALATESQ